MTKQSSIPFLIPVLITRPEPQASRFAAELQAALPGQLQPLIAPLMQVSPLPQPLPPQDFAELVLTSETGAVMAAARRRAGARLPQVALCVGDRTADEAARQGFTAVSASGDAQDLVRLILARPDPGPILYLHGQDRAADLGLALHGQRQITSQAVYAQMPLPLSAPALHLLAQPGPVLLPLLSPRSARLLVAQLPQIRAAQLLAITISANTTRALPQDLAAQALTAHHPDANAVIAALILAVSRLRNTPSP